MSERDKTSRCQGFTPKELQPAAKAAQTRNKTVTRCLTFIMISNGTDLVLGKQLPDLLGTDIALRGPEPDVRESHHSMAVNDDADRHT